MIHLESCVRRAIIICGQREEYDELNEFHCETCEGWGGVVDVVDPALTLYADIGENSVEVENCPDCIEKGLCPRCMTEYNADPESDDYDEECSFCGFVLGETEGKPYPHKCLCEQLEFNK